MGSADLAGRELKQGREEGERKKGGGKEGLMVCAWGVVVGVGVMRKTELTVFLPTDSI